MREWVHVKIVDNAPSNSRYISEIFRENRKCDLDAVSSVVKGVETSENGTISVKSPDLLGEKYDFDTLKMLKFREMNVTRPADH